MTAKHVKIHGAYCVVNHTLDFNERIYYITKLGYDIEDNYVVSPEHNLVVEGAIKSHI